MVGKFFVIALVCATLTQGVPLEEAIQRGLQRAEGINQNGVRRIAAARSEVEFKAQLIQSRTADFIQRSCRTQDGVRQGLRSIARTVEQKAKETNAPQSVFECINRVEENANNQVESFTKKFQDDVRRLEGTKLANIKTDSKPLEGMGNALQVRYDRAVQQVKACKNEGCVNTAVNSFATYLNMMFADIKRVLGQVTTVSTNYQRDANTFLTNANRQISRVKLTASRNLRQCLYSREFDFGAEEESFFQEESFFEEEY